ncbi:MAG: phosphoribosyl-ATP diphosphatase [Psychrilyobacter sp.]|uniref:phosphoribosyl-ATP diphosphatase n=1 Tax=Psychrilyobacter sp. TaxID=2586924 RepID=UPI003C74A65B
MKPSEVPIYVEKDIADIGVSGVDKILKKVGEECTEVIIATKNPDKLELVYEANDLLYHLLVLLNEQEVSLEEIKNQLIKRIK